MVHGLYYVVGFIYESSIPVSYWSPCVYANIILDLGVFTVFSLLPILSSSHFVLLHPSPLPFSAYPPLPLFPPPFPLLPPSAASYCNVELDFMILPALLFWSGLLCHFQSLGFPYCCSFNMRCPHRFMYLNTRSPVDGTALRGGGNFQTVELSWQM